MMPHGEIWQYPSLLLLVNHLYYEIQLMVSLILNSENSISLDSSHLVTSVFRLLKLRLIPKVQ